MNKNGLKKVLLIVLGCMLSSLLVAALCSCRDTPAPPPPTLSGTSWVITSITKDELTMTGDSVAAYGMDGRLEFSSDTEFSITYNNGTTAEGTYVYSEEEATVTMTMGERTFDCPVTGDDLDFETDGVLMVFTRQ